LYDALDNGGSVTNPKYDGWYIDDIRIVPRYDTTIIADIENDVFYDGATNLTNWITEGIWGLDPEVTATGGSSAATLGIWSEYWWDCNNCTSLAPGGTPSNQQMLRGADRFLDNADIVTGVVTGLSSSFNSRTPTRRSVLDINYRMGSGTPRPSVTSYTDNFVGRWVLNTPVIGTASGIAPGQYTFLTLSDNGVRMKIDEIDASGTVISPVRPEATEWNVINNWSDHGEVPDMGRVTLQNGRRYRIILEYYERTGTATLTVSLGGSTFSFTDSPKQGAGVIFPDIPALPNASTTLTLNGVLDLQDTTRPILEYYTLYELNNDSRAIVEVSDDGGFTWRNNGLTTDVPLVTGGCGSGANSSTCEFYDDPEFGGAIRIPGANTWQLRRHNLSLYENKLIMIRFRLNRSTTQCMSSDNTCTSTNWNYNQNGWFVSWWIVDITVAKTS
jgi:hypothetical protein